MDTSDRPRDVIDAVAMRQLVRAENLQPWEGAYFYEFVIISADRRENTPAENVAARVALKAGLRQLNYGFIPIDSSKTKQRDSPLGCPNGTRAPMSQRYRR